MTESDQNNTSKRTKLHQSFKNFLGEHVPQPTIASRSVADIIIYI